MSDPLDETREQLIARIADLTSKLEIFRSLLVNLQEIYRILEEEGIPDAEREAAQAERERVRHYFADGLRKGRSARRLLGDLFTEGFAILDDRPV